MAIISGFNLIRLTPGGVHYLNCTNGQVDYNPERKFRLEKKNAFDPSIIHYRDEYHVDTFDLQAILTPEGYNTLMSFITSAGQLYLEYTAYNEVKSQFPVRVTNFPKCPDDLHEYSDKVKFIVESRYVGSPGYIDFENIQIEDDNEIVILN